MNSAARKRTARLSFSFVYPDKRGRNVMKEIGRVLASDRQPEGESEGKSLAALGFQTGDFLDVAIHRQ